MNEPGLPLHDVFEAEDRRINRRNFLIVAGVAAATAVAASRGLLPGSHQDGTITTGTDPITDSSVGTFDTLAVPQTAIPVPTTEQPASTTTEQSTTTTTTTIEATTTTETVPPSPEFKVLHQYAPGDKIGDLVILTANPKPNFPINFPLYYTDNPNHPQVPLQPAAGADYVDYYGPYIKERPFAPEGPGVAGDSLLPGEKVARDLNGVPLDDPLHRNRDTEVFGHRTTRPNPPFRHIDELSPGDVVVITYQPQDDDPGLANKQVMYRILPDAITGLGYTIVPGEDVTFIRNLEPEQSGLRNILTLYACHPPGSKTERIVVKAEMIEDAPAA